MSAQYEYTSGLFLDVKAEGKAEGKAEMLLDVLAARGIAVDADSEGRILESTDIKQLARWGERSVHITRIEEFFDE
ncbi:hypothetical protein ACGFNU_07310 [Spirillospora sp. NPDC048911]|uniref:hypothetical protein n=1 Tax=Spirillospora sp. NPDC048911 TaxID=3364527 RepID=UPI00370FFF02